MHNRNIEPLRAAAVFWTLLASAATAQTLSWGVNRQGAAAIGTRRQPIGSTALKTSFGRAMEMLSLAAPAEEPSRLLTPARSLRR